MKTLLLLVLPLMMSAYRQPAYYPMTFFSKSPYSHQTNIKPATPHYRQSSAYVRPGIVYEYQFLGHRSLYSTKPELISPLISPELLSPIGNVDPVVEVTTDSLVEEATSADGIIHDITTEETVVSTETNVQDDTTDLLNEQELIPTSAPEKDVTTPALEVIVTEVEATTTILNDFTSTTLSETDTTSESAVNLERHQSIIPFYLKPSAWRSRSFGPDPRSYQQPNHYYGPEEAREF